MADTMEDKGRDASRIDSLWMLYISSGLVFAIGITGVGEPPTPAGHLTLVYPETGDGHRYCHGWPADGAVHR